MNEMDIDVSGLNEIDKELKVEIESFHRSICLWKYPKSTLRLRKISLNHIFKMNLIKKR